MAIRSPKYLDDNVSILKDRSILFKIKAAEKLLYLLDTRRTSASWQQWPVFILKQPLVI